MPLTRFAVINKFNKIICCSWEGWGLVKHFMNKIIPDVQVSTVRSSQHFLLSVPIAEATQTPAQISIYGQRKCWGDGVEDWALQGSVPLQTLCQPSSHSPALSPISSCCSGDKAWHSTASQNQTWPSWTFPPWFTSSKVLRCPLPALLWPCSPWLSDRAVPRAHLALQGSPSRGHQVVQRHCAGSGAICPSGHGHGASWMCQGVLAARAIPRCCWQLVGGTGLCPDGPRFWGATLRDGSWTHPSRVSGGGWECFLLPHSPFPAPVICHPWQQQHWQCHPIARQAGSHPHLPQPAVPATFPHLPPEGQPGLLGAPFCVSFLTTASCVSAHPKTQVTNPFAHHAVPIPQRYPLHWFFSILQQDHTSYPPFPDAHLLSHISFFLTTSQFLFHQLRSSVYPQLVQLPLFLHSPNPPFMAFQHQSGEFFSPIT